MSKVKITPMDLMYFIELVATDSEQTDAFRLEAILTLCALGGYSTQQSLDNVGGKQ